jgi:sugar transferase (PEP-CTERM/EpsH1 system associated)
VKVLYVCHRFPFPPKRGGKIRPFNMIRHLSRDHEVHVASLVRSEAEANEGRGLAEFCDRYAMGRVRNPVQVLRMFARLPTATPSSMGFFYSARLARTIREWLARERYDLIFVHCSSVAQYVAGATGTPKILDFGDMDSQKWLEYARYKPFPLSLGYHLEGRKLEREERRLARRFDLCTATTRAEWETLESYNTGVASDWFPNGVDAEYFAPSAEPYDDDTVAFVGRMDYYPNQECMFDFCRKTLPLLQAKRPALKLLIVGADPSPAVRDLQKLPGVTVTGSVPDVRPYLRRAAVMVAPLKIARGTQNKILEAMAAGVPVVTSSAAAGGVDALAGEHFLVADDPERLAEAVLRIVENPAERNRLAAAGRQRMLSHHNWEHSMQRLDRIVERCIAAARQPDRSGVAKDVASICQPGPSPHDREETKCCLAGDGARAQRRAAHRRLHRQHPCCRP